MGQRILFVAAGPVQRAAMLRAQELGYEVYAVDANPQAAGFDIATAHTVCDITDAQALVQAAKHYNVQAMVAVCTDVPLVAVARACQTLGLPGTPLQTALVSTNKLLQRQCLSDHGIPVPAFYSFRTVQEALEQSASCPLPLVFKPTDNAGSRGVTFVDQEADKAKAAQYALEHSKSGQGLVEEFLPGPEISVEGFVSGGIFYPLCLSEKVRTQPPFLLDKQVHFPHSFPQAEASNVIQMARDAVKACGFDNCPVHMELIRSAHGPRVVELAARGAGFYVFTTILPHVTGVDTIQCQLDLACGRPLHLAPRPSLQGASLVFVDPIPGRFVAAHHVQEARLLPSITEVQIYPKPGDTLGPLQSGAQRAGHILALGKNRQESEAAALQALSTIQLEVLPL